MGRILYQLKYRLRGEIPLLVLLTAAVLSVGARELGRGNRNFRSHPKPGAVRAAKPPPPIPVPEFFKDWRTRFLTLNREEDRLGLVRGIFLGDDSSIPTTVRDEFRAAGLSHLLAASGYNCWIVAMAFGLLGKMLLVGVAGRLPSRTGLRARKLVTPLARLLGAWLFWLWTDQSPPITRSVFLISGAFALDLMGWVAAFPRLLLIQYLISLAVMPSLWQSASFQLTFGCLFGLVLFPTLVERFAPAQDSWRRPLWNYFCAGFGACLGTIPTTWLVFGEVNFMSLTTNWFAVPPVSAILMPAALLQMLLAMPHAPWSGTAATDLLFCICLKLAVGTALALHWALGVWLTVMPALRYVD